MGKSRFVENTTSIDKAKLRLRRKEVLGYSIFSVLFSLVPKSMMKLTTGFEHIRVIDLIIYIIAGIILVLVIIAFIQGIRALYGLTKMIYTKPIGYFVVYLLLIFVGSFILGIFGIFGLVSIWFEVRKFLK